MQEKSKRFYKSAVRDSIYVLLSSVILACGVFFFVVPNQFAPGGVTGIASMLEFATNGAFKASYSLFVFNFPLIIVSFFFVSKRFAFATLANILCLSLWLTLFENTVPATAIPTFGTNTIFAGIAAGLCTGVALALILRVGGSTGGSDIVAMMIQRKYSATNISWFIFAIDVVIVTVSAFVFRNGLEPVMLALVELFVAAKVNELATNGQLNAIKFEVVTDKPDELSKAIFERLDRGVTEIPAIGKFTGVPKHILCVVIRKRQLTTFRRILKEIDPHAFAYMMTTSEVMGEGFLSSH